VDGWGEVVKMSGVCNCDCSACKGCDYKVTVVYHLPREPEKKVRVHIGELEKTICQIFSEGVEGLAFKLPYRSSWFFFKRDKWERLKRGEAADITIIDDPVIRSGGRSVNIRWDDFLVIASIR